MVGSTTAPVSGTSYGRQNWQRNCYCGSSGLDMPCRYGYSLTIDWERRWELEMAPFAPPGGRHSPHVSLIRTCISGVLDGVDQTVYCCDVNVSRPPVPVHGHHKETFAVAGEDEVVCRDRRSGRCQRM